MILVVGSTGDLGRSIVRKLVGDGQRVRCLVRAGSDRSALPDGVDLVEGDLTQPDSLRAACEGVTTVVSGATAIGRRLSGASKQSIRKVDGEGMAALVEAAEAAGVERFVYVSYAGVDLGLGMPLERAKLATERRLAASRLRTVVVRPDAFQEVHLGPLGRFDIAAGKVPRGDRGGRAFDGPHLQGQRVPLLFGRLGMRLLARPNDALASIFGTGVLQDRSPATWDDGPLRERGIRGRSATEWIEQPPAARR